MRVALALILVALLPAVARAADPSIEDGSAQAALDSAESHWSAYGADDYGYTVERQCFCSPGRRGPYDIVVKDGSAANRTKANRGVNTVPQLFEQIQTLISQDADTLSVTYDDTTGVPLKMAADPNANAVDDERGFSVTDFHTPDEGISEGYAATMLAAARRDWRRYGRHDYALRVQVNGAEWRFMVRGDRAVDPPEKGRRYATVPRLFAIVDDAIERGVARLDFLFGRYGVPRRITIDDLRIRSRLRPLHG
jgi:hypothetical protein